MLLDEKLFREMEAGLISPTLRVYPWESPCITYGYAQKIEELIDIKDYREKGWEIVRRPTGGGIVFHEPGEVAYSVAARIDDPAVGGSLMETYRTVSSIIMAALRKLGVDVHLSGEKSTRRAKLCFDRTMPYDLVADGKKVVGSAQRRGKFAFLQQGTIKFPGLDWQETAKVLALSVYPERSRRVVEGLALSAVEGLRDNFQSTLGIS